MNRALRITRAMRAEVITQAQRCEHWLGEAQKLEDAGYQGSGYCLRSIAQQRSEQAFAAVAKARAELAQVSA
jgi:hypothetical protein